jgi:hypothetical protein
LQIDKNYVQVLLTAHSGDFMLTLEINAIQSVEFDDQLSRLLDRYEIRNDYFYPDFLVEYEELCALNKMFFDTSHSAQVFYTI